MLEDGRVMGSERGREEEEVRGEERREERARSSAAETDCSPQRRSSTRNVD